MQGCIAASVYDLCDAVTNIRQLFDLSGFYVFIDKDKAGKSGAWQYYSAVSRADSL